MATIIGSGLEAYLHRQAREHALNRIEEAKEEAQRILADAADEAERVKQQIEEQTADLVDERRRRTLAQARLRAKQMAVRSQEELIERVWSEAASMLQGALEGEKRLAILQRNITDAAQQMEGGPLEIEVNDQDRQLLNSRALAKIERELQGALDGTSLAMSDGVASTWGGATVRRTDANQLVDNSLNERWVLARRTLRDHVYRLLATAQTSSA